MKRRNAISVLLYLLGVALFCDCQFLSCQRQSDPPDVLSTGRSLRCGSLFHRNRSIHFSV